MVGPRPIRRVRLTFGTTPKRCLPSRRIAGATLLIHTWLGLSILSPSDLSRGRTHHSRLSGSRRIPSKLIKSHAGSRGYGNVPTGGGQRTDVVPLIGGKGLIRTREQPWKPCSLTSAEV
jgi:hypothetical protein